MTKSSCLAWGILSLVACGSGTSVSEPKVPISTISLGGDLTAIDLCQAIPPEDIEAVMGRKLVGGPKRFEYTDTSDTSGCSYHSGKDAEGNAHFGYVALTPLAEYESQPLYEKTDVDGLGKRAYFNNGADARQLWVQVDDRTAFVVAFGDEPNEEGARAIAGLLVAAIR